ncbi:MAG: C69 family dipeptidase, partial [Chlamydiota bacterium]
MKFCLSFFLLWQFPIFCCTNFLITKGASEDGSVMIGHTDDGIPGDPRVVFVPAKKYVAGEKKPLFLADPIFLANADYPRYVGKERAPAYDISGFPITKPIGYIDQVSATNAYIEGIYGIMNEWQLAMGEATAPSLFNFDFDKDNRLLDISELTRLGLERCKTAKEAILLMGSLAEKYGFYGDGEVLLVGDLEEGWVFEISGSPEKKGAIWVAKKIPEGEVFVSANIFRIQEIDPKDPNVLYSSQLFSIAEKNKWWKKEKNELFNWQKAVSAGEPNHPYYSLRRIWRLFQKMNPSILLSPWVENAFTKKYPLSMKVSQKLSLKKALSLFRDHYEGTEFDLTKGLAAGPYGDPNRNLQPDNPKIKGAFERPISYRYTVYSYITQSRKNMHPFIGGKVWVGFGEPAQTCYMPCFVHVEDLPAPFQKGSSIAYDESLGWFHFNFISNWVASFYCYSIKDV